MDKYLLTHLQDAVLLRDLKAFAADERAKTAVVLAHIAEVDQRKLYLTEGYPSMFAFCTGELHFSEDSAYKRIQAARAARKFPALFIALADGRVHLTAIRLLAPRLTTANADELIAGATHKGSRDMELWLAGRFPQAGAMRLDDGLSPVPVALAPDAPELAARQVDPRAAELAARQVVTPSPQTRIAPLSADWSRLDVLVPKRLEDKIRYAQELDRHLVPSGDVVAILELAVDDHIAKREKQKFAATRKPQRATRPSTRPRHVPARVKRAVWERDQGRCTFVGTSGRQCDARSFLEFDHVDPVARGGTATIEGMRLRCRPHNQLEAEKAFGPDFMEKKRAQEARTRDVTSALRNLGMSARDARLAAEQASSEGSLEDHIRAALRSLKPRTIHAEPPARTQSPAPQVGQFA